MCAEEDSSPAGDLELDVGGDLSLELDIGGEAAVIESIIHKTLNLIYLFTIDATLIHMEL